MIDTLNGAMLKYFGGGFGISQAYKALIIVMVFLFVEVKYFLCLLGILILALSMYLVNFLRGYDDYESLVWLGRVVCVWGTYFVFLSCIRLDEVYARNFFLSFSVFSLLIAFVNVGLGFIGYGSTQYGDGVGGIGFIYAGNELTLLIVSCQLAILTLVFSNKNYTVFWIISSVFIVLTVFKATKTAVLAMGLYFIIFLMASIFKRGGVKRFLKMSPLFISGVYGAIFIFYNFGLADRLIYFYNELDFWTFVFSGRNILAVNVFDFATQHFSVVDWIFGRGVGELKLVIGSQVEIDPVDVFFGFGIFGGVFFYSFMIYRFIHVLYLLFKKRILINFIEMFFIGLLFFISCFAGHVVNSGISAVYISLVFAVFELLRREIR